jgi:hypothetical protein
VALERLAAWAGTLPDKGLRLVPASALLAEPPGGGERRRAAGGGSGSGGTMRRTRVGCRETTEPTPGYRPCVGIFLLSRERQVLVGRRRDSALDAWQMPQGGIDPIYEEPRYARRAGCSRSHSTREDRESGTTSSGTPQTLRALAVERRWPGSLVHRHSTPGSLP